jgi:hypothetical protein
VAASSQPKEYQFGQFSYRIDPEIGAWVKPLKTPKSRGKVQGQNTEYLKLDAQRYAVGGEFHMFRARSELLHTSQALSEASEISVGFYSDYQTLTIHKLNIVRDGEVISKLDPNNIRLLQQEDDLRSGILNGLVTAHIIVPGTRVGDQLDFDYTVSGNNPVFGDKVFGSYQFGWSLEVGLSQFRLLVDRDKDIDFQLHGIDLKHKNKKGKQYQEHIWKTKSVDAILDEGNYPSWYVRFPFLEYTEFASWQEVESWASDLFSEVNQESPELKKLATKLARETKSDTEFAEQALTFTQNNIRYLGLELGVNSHLPHDPEEVLSNRFGDCKDKSNLLVQLLKTQGISADVALVSVQLEGAITRFLPSPSVFDHAIVTAQIDGQTVWIDPTRTYEAGGFENRGGMYYEHAMVVDSKIDGDLKPVELLRGQVDSVTVTENISFDSIDKPAKLIVTARYTGNAADQQRYRFDNYSLEEIQLNYTNYYTKLYPGAQVASQIKFVDNQELNAFEVTEEYEVDDLFENIEGLYRGEFYASTISEYLVMPEKRSRETPINIGQPKVIKHNVIVDFPADIDFNIDSTPLIKADDAYRYTSRSAYFDRRFEYRASLQVSKPDLAVDKIPDYVAVGDFIKGDIDFYLSFEMPTDKSKSSKSRKKLMRALGK